MKSVVFTLSSLIFTINCLFAQNPCWVQKTDMPTARWGLSASEVNGKIYVLGGSQSTTPPGYSIGTLEVYDPAQDTWDTTKSPMPTERLMFMTSVVNGKIYVIGGRQEWTTGVDLGTVEMYDPLSDTWETKTPMPKPRTNAGVCVFGDKIYIIGGIKDSSVFDFSNDLQIYHPSTDTWDTTKTPMNYRRDPYACVLNDLIFVIGGTDGPPYAGLHTVEAYDTTSDTWTQKASTQEGRKGSSVEVINGEIFAIGGEDIAEPVMDLEVYNHVADRWTRLSQTPIWYTLHASSVFQDKIYLIGGSIIGGRNDIFQPTPIIYEYDPHKDLTGLVDFVDVNRKYVAPSIDSVLIITKMRNPAGITLYGEIQAPDQTPVDSLQLFDDGNHHDGEAGDSLFANIWPVLPVEERLYYVDLKVTRIDTDTIVNHMNNMANFTTIGPLVFDHYEIPFHNPTRFSLKLFLRNDGVVAIAPGVSAEISTADTNITGISGNNQSFGDMAPGQTKTSGNYIINTQNNPTSVHFTVSIFSNGWFFWSDSFSVSITGLTGNETSISTEYILKQNYPNPFNPNTTIEFSLARANRVTLKVFNIVSEQMEILVSDKLSAGSYTYEWDASKFASGIYLYRLQAGDFVETKKMVLLK